MTILMNEQIVDALDKNIWDIGEMDFFLPGVKWEKEKQQ